VAGDSLNGFERAVILEEICNHGIKILVKLRQQPGNSLISNVAADPVPDEGSDLSLLRQKSAG
jgi:hypothetical protein